MYTDGNKNNNKYSNSSADNFYNYKIDYDEYKDNALYDEVEEDNFYSEMKVVNTPEGQDDKKLKKIFIIIGISASLGIILLIIAIIMFSNKNDGPDINIKLLTEKIILGIGEEKNISFEIEGTNTDIQATFKSKNPSVATVDENGKVVGVSEGDSTIIIKYKSGRRTKEEKCDVIVVK